MVTYFGQIKPGDGTTFCRESAATGEIYASKVIGYCSITTKRLSSRLKQSFTFITARKSYS